MRECQGFLCEMARSQHPVVLQLGVPSQAPGGCVPPPQTGVGPPHAGSSGSRPETPRHRHLILRGSGGP